MPKFRVDLGRLVREQCSVIVEAASKNAVWAAIDDLYDEVDALWEPDAEWGTEKGDSNCVTRDPAHAAADFAITADGLIEAVTTATVPPPFPRLRRDVTAGEIGMDSSPEEVAQEPQLWGADSIVAPAGTPVVILDRPYADVWDVCILVEGGTIGGSGLTVYLPPAAIEEVTDGGPSQG